MSTSVGTAVNGSIAALDASGTSSMSDSSIVWNPRIEEPSKPSPSSKMSSFSSEIGIEKCCQRSEEHTSELQSRLHLVCRLLLEKKKKTRSKLELNRYNR